MPGTGISGLAKQPETGETNPMKSPLTECLRITLLLLLFGLSSLPAEENLSLAGKWRFSRDQAKVGLTEKWYEGELKTVGAGPSEISLPGSTDQAKAGVPNPQKPNLRGLYRPNVYAGPAWYQREVAIPAAWKGKHVTLFLERNHWTVHVWLDGEDMGTQDSLIAPQIYDFGTDVAPGKHLLTICVDNTLKLNLGPIVSINYPAGQTNWNGIVGAIELRASDPVALSDVQIYPDVDHKLIKVEAHISNVTGLTVGGDLDCSVTDQTGAAATTPVSIPFSAPNAGSVVTLNIPMGDHPKLWDEFSPNLYVLKTSLSATSPGCHSEKDVSFGMRKFAIRGRQFTMNGRPLFLRGTLECCIFPLTGFPPTDVASWQRIYRIEKSYGLNFIRFHSWCPPDAAFAAADLEGVMIQAEGPLSNVNDVGQDPKRDAFVEAELIRMIHTYGNHPSFCLMPIGNELKGNTNALTPNLLPQQFSNEIDNKVKGNTNAMSHWVDMLIQADPRHLYSSASGFDETPNTQWSESYKGRGVRYPGTEYTLEDVVAREDRPVTGHEIGQWLFYPNFDEINKYTGVLEAKNFELIQSDLRAKGMADEAVSFFRTTGEEARLLYKEEIEMLLRTPGYAGFSLLDLHDYPGQGTALVGLLDPFWDSKGFITPEEHKRYCGSTVPLLCFPKRVYTTDETFSAKAEVAHFGPADLSGAQPEWTILDQGGHTIAQGSLPGISLASGKLNELGTMNASLSTAAAPIKLTVTLSLRNTPFSNSWNIWVYPPPAVVAIPANVTVSHAWDDATRAALAEGKKVILFPTRINPGQSLAGSFQPVFWSPNSFPTKGTTMGILCDPANPLFALFPTEFYSDWQWWNLIQGSQTMILNGTPSGFRPLVQVVDNFARNDKLGNIFEARVGNGELLVCTLNLGNGQTPEAAQFLRSLYAYVSSDAFRPAAELTTSWLDLLLEPTSKPVKMAAAQTGGEQYFPPPVRSARRG